MFGILTVLLLLAALFGGPAGALVVGARPGLRRRIAMVASTITVALVASFGWTLSRPDGYYGPNSTRRVWDNDPSGRPVVVVAIILGLAIAGLLAFGAAEPDDRPGIRRLTAVGLSLTPLAAVAVFVGGLAIGLH